MKKATFFSLLLLFGFVIDASAYHFRLAHRHYIQPSSSGLQFVPSASMPVMQSGLGGGVATGITIPAEVGQQIKDTTKYLRDASTTLSPLITKYKLDKTNSPDDETTPAPKRNALKNLTPEQREKLIRSILND